MTSLASIFPAEEAHKASKRVQDTLVERQTELDQVRGFIADNTNLINQVQRLPDELYHDIMASSLNPKMLSLCLSSFQSQLVS